MSEELFISSYNEQSQRHAILADNGTTAWLYLHAQSPDASKSGSVEATAFAYNRISLIETDSVQSYRPDPPPLAKGYGSDAAVCYQPKQHEWSIAWLSSGQSVFLKRDGLAWCLIVEGDKMGYSKSIASDGPWGHPWDEMKLKEIS